MSIVNAEVTHQSEEEEKSLQKKVARGIERIKKAELKDPQPGQMAISWCIGFNKQFGTGHKDFVVRTRAKEEDKRDSLWDKERYEFSTLEEAEETCNKIAEEQKKPAPLLYDSATMCTSCIKLQDEYFKKT